MKDHRVEELQEMAKSLQITDSRLLEAAEGIASDLPGLRALVDHRHDIGSSRLLPIISFCLARACNNWDPPDPHLRQVVFEFIDNQIGNNPTLLVNILNALGGLQANHLLDVATPDERSRFSEFLLSCLDHGNLVVISESLDLIGQLWHDDLLDQLVAPSTLEGLRMRLARLATEENGEFSEDLAPLHMFWER